MKGLSQIAVILIVNLIYYAARLFVFGFDF